MRMHHIYSMTSTLHIHRGGCVTRASHMHSIYIIEHTWHILLDADTTHKSVFMWLQYIYTMVYTQHMHHGGRVTHTWSSICRAIILSQLCIFGMTIQHSYIKLMYILQFHFFRTPLWMVLMLKNKILPETETVENIDITL